LEENLENLGAVALGLLQGKTRFQEEAAIAWASYEKKVRLNKLQLRAVG
jgi:hypothetical protein